MVTRGVQVYVSCEQELNSPRDEETVCREKDLCEGREVLLWW